MPNIATLHMNKAKLAHTVFNISYLYKTRNDESGPLRQIMSWLYGQVGGNFFKQDDVKLNRDEDHDFVILYYFNGKRYKVLRDGHCIISGADPEEFFEEEQKEFQDVIDTILADELHKRIEGVCEGLGVKCGRAKGIGADNDGNRNSNGKEEPSRAKSMFGIIGPDDLSSFASMGNA